MYASCCAASCRLLHYAASARRRGALHRAEADDCGESFRYTGRRDGYGRGGGSPCQGT